MIHLKKDNSENDKSEKRQFWKQKGSKKDSYEKEKPKRRRFGKGHI